MRHLPSLTAAVVLGLMVSLAAQADDAGITAHHGKIYETREAGQTTQGFLEIDNSLATPDRLTGVNCPVAGSTIMVSKDGAPIRGLALAAGEHLLLSANGPHFLLQSTRFTIDTGGSIPCSLTFQNAGEIQIYLYPIPAP